MTENNKIENITFSNNINFVNKKIKDCEDHNLFDFISSQSFSISFLDLQEMNKFITYLYENKSELSIKELIENSNIIIEEFNKKTYK